MGKRKVSLLEIPRNCERFCGFARLMQEVLTKRRIPDKKDF